MPFAQSPPCRGQALPPRLLHLHSGLHPTRLRPLSLPPACVRLTLRAGMACIPRQISTRCRVVKGKSVLWRTTSRGAYENFVEILRRKIQPFLAVSLVVVPSCSRFLSRVTPTRRDLRQYPVHFLVQSVRCGARVSGIPCTTVRVELLGRGQELSMHPRALQLAAKVSRTPQSHEKSLPPFPVCLPRTYTFSTCHGVEAGWLVGWPRRARVQHLEGRCEFHSCFVCAKVWVCLRRKYHTFRGMPRLPRTRIARSHGDTVDRWRWMRVTRREVGTCFASCA